MKHIALILAILLLAGCSRNVDEAKACAPAAVRQMGFEIIGYEGYTLDLIYGGFAWYTLKRIPDNGIIYGAAVSPWAGECHVYKLRAVDAIKP